MKTFIYHFQKCINWFNSLSFRSMYLSAWSCILHRPPPGPNSQSSLFEASSSPSGSFSGSGGYIGSTFRFCRNLACFSRLLRRLRVLFFTLTLNPCRHRLLGKKMLLSRMPDTLSRYPSASNGDSSSVRFSPSNSTGPKMKGRAIFCLSALSKLAGMYGSNCSFSGS